MAKGPKLHLKRVSAPAHWMLSKLTGIWAPRPSCGPHKLRECLPLILLLRNRLKYALTYREVKMIVLQRLIKVDQKIRTDMRYPAGFGDVITIEKTDENFRLLFNCFGRFVVHKIHKDEATYKLCRVKKIVLEKKGKIYAATNDGRMIRYPDPEIKANDTVRVDLPSGKILDFLKFDIGCLCMVTGGKNVGRVGIVENIEKHPGSIDVIHLRDSNDHSFATKISNVFVIGSEGKPWISLPKGEGVKEGKIEHRLRIMGQEE